MTRTVLTDDRHDLFLDTFAERNFSVADSDVSASLDNSLWGTLCGGAEGVNVMVSTFITPFLYVGGTQSASFTNCLV